MYRTDAPDATRIASRERERPEVVFVGSLTLPARQEPWIVAMPTANHPGPLQRTGAPARSPGVGIGNRHPGTVADVIKVLSAAGFAVPQLGISLDPPAAARRDEASRPDAVFNLFEGVPTGPGRRVGGRGALGMARCGRSPGARRRAWRSGRNKVGSKHLLAGAGLPTAKYVVVEGEPIPLWANGWPAIVKPGLQDASVGIDQAAWWRIKRICTAGWPAAY